MSLFNLSLLSQAAYTIIFGEGNNNKHKTKSSLQTTKFLLRLIVFCRENHFEVNASAPFNLLLATAKRVRQSW